MWNQVWPITELQIIDCETRKIIVENGAKHPLGSTELLYRPRDTGGRGMKSLEAEYKITKIKAAVHLYANLDLTMGQVREFKRKQPVQDGDLL